MSAGKLRSAFPHGPDVCFGHPSCCLIKSTAGQVFVHVIWKLTRVLAIEDIAVFVSHHGKAGLHGRLVPTERIRGRPWNPDVSLLKLVVHVLRSFFQCCLEIFRFQFLIGQLLERAAWLKIGPRAFFESWLGSVTFFGIGEPVYVNITQRIMQVSVNIDAAALAGRVRLNVASQAGAEIAKSVVMKLRLLVEVMARKAQRHVDRAAWINVGRAVRIDLRTPADLAPIVLDAYWRADLVRENKVALSRFRFGIEARILNEEEGRKGDI